MRNPTAPGTMRNDRRSTATLGTFHPVRSGLDRFCPVPPTLEHSTVDTVSATHLDERGSACVRWHWQSALVCVHCSWQ